jgi:hypothetical protein
MSSHRIESGRGCKPVKLAEQHLIAINIQTRLSAFFALSQWLHFSIHSSRSAQPTPAAASFEIELHPKKQQ